MKKLIPLFTLALMCNVASSQDVTLSFTAREGLTDAYVLLSRVEIKNVTKGWTETLTFPDTTAPLTVGVGINEMSANNGFFLSPNNPNPFNGTTDVELSVGENGTVALELMDANGRTLELWRSISLQPGIHHFRISVANAGIYLLSAHQNGHSSSVKMVNNGGTANGIEYVGSVGTKITAFPTKGAITRAFDWDDVLTYKGFAFVGGEEIESEIVAPYQAQSEDVTLIFNISRICPESPTVTDDDGNLYYTVLMGEQCWMRENLRTTHYVHWNLADVRLCGGTTKNPEVDSEACYFDIDFTYPNTSYPHYYPVQGGLSVRCIKDN